jgi:hypothetical protein
VRRMSSYNMSSVAVSNNNNIKCSIGRKKRDSDFASDITNVIADPYSPTSTYFFPKIEEGLDFILSHFREAAFPRTISTKATEGRQIVVYSRDEALARFKAANLLDCKINAYPKYVEWEGINRQAPNFIFIDLDQGRFKSRRTLDRVLDKTLSNINEKFKTSVVYPTIIWSGHGYHIYLPVEAFLLEQESEFVRFGNNNPSRKFIQFAEEYLSDNKADPCHTKGLSFKNCMLRVPGSFNSKDGKLEEVKIVQKWNGYRPIIQPLLFRFDLYLLASKSKELHHHHNKTKWKNNNNWGSHEPKVFSTNWMRRK